MYNFSDYTLGESSGEVLEIETRRENADAALELVKQCQLKLAIVSHCLDPFVYDNPEFVEALRTLALKGPHVEIRILVFEAEQIIRRGHKILHLAGRLSSYIELRKPLPEHKSFNEAMLIADNTAYLHRENMERYAGKVNFNSRRESKYLMDIFNKLWQSAKPDPNLRRMYL